MEVVTTAVPMKTSVLANLRLSIPSTLFPKTLLFYNDYQQLVILSDLLEIHK
jgi:hypothetical protein